MLLVFSDDWGRHPSSCQHLVRNLLRRHQVIWVNTIGMRGPGCDLATLKRGWEKLRQWSRGSDRRSAAGNPVVMNPRMWPWFRWPLDRWLNRRLLASALKPVLADSSEPVYAITTIPVVADLIGRLAVDRWLYYCVDDFSTWPGLNPVTMQTMEQKLIDRCDDVIAVSETLVNRLNRQSRTAKFLSHGVDLEFWRHPGTTGLAEHFRGHERPWIVFWGVVDRRMNASWVQRLASDLQRGTVLLVGPRDRPEAGLLCHPRVAHIPPLEFQRLPELGALADVLMMPYADLPVTRAMQPLKLKEYLATGKPVVGSRLPALSEWEDCLDIADSAEAFVHLVQSRLQGGVPSRQIQARQRLESESWSAKAVQFERWVLGTESDAKVNSIAADSVVIGAP